MTEKSNAAWKHNSFRGRVALSQSTCEQILLLTTATPEAKQQAEIALQEITQLAELLRVRKDS